MVNIRTTSFTSVLGITGSASLKPTAKGPGGSTTPPSPLSFTPWVSMSGTNTVWKTSPSSALNSNNGNTRPIVYSPVSRSVNLAVSASAFKLQNGSYFGLSDVAYTLANFTVAEVYWYTYGAGSLEGYTSSNLRCTSTYTPSDILAISYDGAYYNFYKNGTLLGSQSRAGAIVDGVTVDGAKVAGFNIPGSGSGWTNIGFSELTGSTTPPLPQTSIRFR